ncbi:hypothetical protein E2986_08938 [Frieseomelitta varia]|uniref:Ribonuclease P/MRP protein subunit POP5 n=1 Tax=Frieseomelitta varia TaxID=561572 RepID=A0A833VNR9_9HYME|nr:ribonuclease P/MRP protein subunit POP5 [Frieseomelitta varia]XP_043513287.1 ribonuclease P/MRP protein subunit POP5 [Frieseomelitta varia]XP_043513288.1 ribonuclease P/MRP protein subunit POP5 [Frieseomelitta varia]KAF3426116.1 hypothetical protein E2986_08938 [Frieseomelitta varia]
MVRFKNRYIAFEITFGDKSKKPVQLKATTLHNAIQQKVQRLYGDFGVAATKAGFSAKYCNIHTKIAIVKCRHGPHKFLLNAIPVINDIAGRLVSVKILYVGATMKHCFLFIKKFQQQKLEQVWNTLKTETERKNMKDALMTLTPAMKDCT